MPYKYSRLTTSPEPPYEVYAQQMNVTVIYNYGLLSPVDPSFLSRKIYNIGLQPI